MGQWRGAAAHARSFEHEWGGDLRGGGYGEIASDRGSYYCQQLFTTYLQFPAHKVIIGSLRAS